MKNLEKIHLIKEIKVLNASLKNETLSLFEIVQVKKRLAEIYSTCHDPLLKKYFPKNLIDNSINVIHPTDFAFTQDINSNTTHQINQTISETNTLEKIEINEIANLKHQENSPPQVTDTEITIDALNYALEPILYHQNEVKVYQVQHHQHFITLLLNAESIHNFTHFSVFITEILKDDIFLQYLIYLGAKDEQSSIRHIEEYAQLHGITIAAIRKSSWKNLEQKIFNIEHIAESFTQSTAIIWQKDAYFPYIPQQLTPQKKFFFFEEDVASIHTPLILLEERGKIRLICGENRLMLNSNEVAYPYVIYQRQQGLNWQMIQSTIAKLPKPINSFNLINALNSMCHIS